MKIVKQGVMDSAWTETVICQGCLTHIELEYNDLIMIRPGKMDRGGSNKIAITCPKCHTRIVLIERVPQSLKLLPLNTESDD